MIGLEVDDLSVFSESKDLNIETPSIDNIVPKGGLFLGLDISKNSTGVALVENGEIITGNIVLEEKKGVHREVLLRRALKEDLKQLVSGKHFDLIIIEDAFIGENAETVRLLFALNTAIDELVLDGVCSTKEFVRVSNQGWKSWLSVIDSEGVTKGLNDKEKIRIWMSMLGVEDEGEGYQDRLDSLGLVLSYFLKGKNFVKNGELVKKRKVKFSDICASYDYDSQYLFYGLDDVNRDNIVFLDYKKISKSRVIELLSDNPDSVFVIDNRILLGNLGIDLGLDIIEGGGYFAFWVNPKKLNKYL